MATSTKPRTSRSARKSRSRAKSGPDAAIERLSDSLEAAQKTAEALRKDVTAGGRDLLDDVERMIKAARKDLAKLNRAVRSDLASLERSVRGQSTPRRGHAASSSKPRSTKRSGAPAAKR